MRTAGVGAAGSPGVAPPRGMTSCDVFLTLRKFSETDSRGVILGVFNHEESAGEVRFVIGGPEIVESGVVVGTW